MPEQHHELAGDRDRGDAGTAACLDPLPEGPERARVADHDPGRLAEHVPGLRGALLGDVAGACGPLAGLAHPRIEPERGDELARVAEAADVADAGHERRRGLQVDPGHAHQLAHLAGTDRRLGQRAVDRGDLRVEEIDLAQTVVDGLALVVGQLDALEEAPAARAGDVVDARPVERLRCSAAAISFLARLRWRTSCAAARPGAAAPWSARPGTRPRPASCRSQERWSVVSLVVCGWGCRVVVGSCSGRASW